MIYFCWNLSGHFNPKQNLNLVKPVNTLRMNFYYSDYRQVIDSYIYVSCFQIWCKDSN